MSEIKQPAVAALATSMRDEFIVLGVHAPAAAEIMLWFSDQIPESAPTISAGLLAQSVLRLANGNRHDLQREYVTVRTLFPGRLEELHEVMVEAKLPGDVADFILRRIAAIARAFRIARRMERDEEPESDFRPPAARAHTRNSRNRLIRLSRAS